MLGTGRHRHIGFLGNNSSGPRRPEVRKSRAAYRDASHSSLIFSLLISPPRWPVTETAFFRSSLCWFWLSLLEFPIHKAKVYSLKLSSFRPPSSQSPNPSPACHPSKSWIDRFILFPLHLIQGTGCHQGDKTLFKPLLATS